jgi:glycosyltransferase involved in cell wall biosynthesis/uridine phosphorylase
MTNPKNLVDIARVIEKESKSADCIYIHADGYLLKNFINKDVPIITSYHDFIYPITISSAFQGFFDKIVIPSKYVYECFKHSIGNLYENVMQRVELINNGIDESIFYKDNSKTDELKTKLKIKEGEKVILFPHRPEISKGIKEALELLHRLLENGLSVRLLFPEYIDYKYDEAVRREYNSLRKELADRGLSQNVSFFEWTPYDQMRHFYSLADITLNIGNFVEAFGLVPLESILCQTPVICTRAGSLRHNLPENTAGIELFNYGDKDDMFEKVLKLLNSPKISFVAAMRHISKNFNYQLMLQKYERVFESITKSSELKKKKYMESEDYALAPWCYLSNKRIYDDYVGDYVKATPFVLSILKNREIINKSEIPQKDEKLIKKNVLIPISKADFTPELKKPATLAARIQFNAILSEEIETHLTVKNNTVKKRECHPVCMIYESKFKRIKMDKPEILDNNPDDEDIITPKKEYEYELKFSQKKKYPENCFVFFQPGIMKKFTEGMKVELVENLIKNYPFYKASGKFGVILFGIGAPLSALLLERLIVRGVKNFITVGTCGSLKMNSKPGEICLCTKSVRDEGTSYHYTRPSKYAEPSSQLNNAIRKKFRKDKVPFFEGVCWTTDSGYKESKIKAKKYMKEGVVCIDMESASLFAVAEHRSVNVSSIFILSDFIDNSLNWSPQFHKKAIVHSAEKIRNSLVSVFQ